MSVFSRKAGALLVAVAIGVSGAVACSSGDDARKLTVAFVVDPWWSHVPVAQKAGYFTQHGLEVNVVNFSTGVEALQALTAGQVDIATAAAASAALTKTPELRVVADGSRWNGFRIVACKESGIASLADLGGKRIGTPLGTSGAYFASSVLAEAKADAELVQVAPSAIVTAATQVDVDAASIFQPYQAQAIQALGDDAVVIPSADGFVDHCLYLATTKVTDGMAADLSAFFAALGDASKDLAAQTPDSIAAVADATHLDAGLVKGVLAEYDFELQLAPALADDLTRLGTWAKDNGKISADVGLPDYQNFIDDKFLAQ